MQHSRRMFIKYISGFVRWMTKNTKHLRHYDKIQCMSGGQELGQKNFGKLLSQITGETFCESDLTTIILIPCVILGRVVKYAQNE